MYYLHFLIFKHFKTTSQNKRDKTFMVSNERCLIINTLGFGMSVSTMQFSFKLLSNKEVYRNRNELSCHYFILGYRKHGTIFF